MSEIRKDTIIEYAYDIENETYIIGVKNNLRNFLATKNYKVDPWGSFTVRDEESKHSYHSLSYLANLINGGSAENDNPQLLGNPRNKIKKLLDSSTVHIDPLIINKICKIYGFPIGAIYSGKEISVADAFAIMHSLEQEKLFELKPFAPLSKASHSAYFREFYGYTFNHLPEKEDEILKFKLSIYEYEDRQPRAEYIFYDSHNEKQVFTGTPYYLPEQNAIAIEMTAADKRRYQYLYFCAPAHHHIVYKHGVCVRTSSASDNKAPDVKSFILTDFELDQNTVNSAVHGLLKMSFDKFYITASKLEKLEKESAEIEAFHKNHPTDFVLIDNAVYLVKEMKLLKTSEYESNEVQAFTAKCLATIKAFSLAPNKIIYRNSDADYKYFKNLTT